MEAKAVMEENMAGIIETDQPCLAEVDPAVPAMNTVLPLVWIPQLQAWFVDTSRLGRTPSATGENIPWLGNRNDGENVMRTNMTHSANQHEFSFSNPNYQQRVFNNQTRNTGESMFGINIPDCAALPHHNQAHAMNESNTFSSMWPTLRTYNEKVPGQENIYSDVISSQNNPTSTYFQIPNPDYVRYGFQGVQLHESRMGHDHVPRLEDIRDEFYGSQHHTHQHEFGFPSFIAQPMTSLFEDQLLEAIDSSSFRNQVGDSSVENQVGDNSYYMDNSIAVAPFLPQHATQTSPFLLSRSQEQDNGVCNGIHDYRMETAELPSVEELGETLGYVVCTHEQKNDHLPSSEELGERLGFVRIDDTGSFTGSLLNNSNESSNQAVKLTIQDGPCGNGHAVSIRSFFFEDDDEHEGYKVFG